MRFRSRLPVRCINDDIGQSGVVIRVMMKAKITAAKYRPRTDISEPLAFSCEYQTIGATTAAEKASKSSMFATIRMRNTLMIIENIEIPADLVARLEGKSSLGRIGLLIHSTAGYVDPGWKGNLTLELSNVSNLPITLYYKMKIGQLSFLQLTTPATRLYGSSELGSKYQGQTLPTASKLHKDFPSK